MDEAKLRPIEGSLLECFPEIRLLSLRFILDTFGHTVTCLEIKHLLNCTDHESECLTWAD